MPSTAEYLGPTSSGVAHLAFYCGALAMLKIVQAVIDGAVGEGTTEIAIDGLREELEGLIEWSGETLS